MRVASIASAIALVIAGLAGAATPATAAGISLNIGDIAFGYSDGYWDRGHQWHDWGPAEAKYYRAHGGKHYVAHRHDREKDGGYHKEYWHDEHR